MQGPDHGDSVGRKGMWDWIPTLVAFLAIYAVLFVFYRPDLLFSMTTTTGGDTGAYHYPMQVLIQDLLPHFKLTGWAPGWYAGMPMFTFYFPFPFLLIAFLQLDHPLPDRIQDRDRPGGVRAACRHVRFCALASHPASVPGARGRICSSSSFSCRATPSTAGTS